MIKICTLTKIFSVFKYTKREHSKLFKDLYAQTWLDDVN